MSDFAITLSVILVALAGTVALAASSLRFRPVWVKEGPLAPKWTKVVLMSLVAGLGASMLAYRLYAGDYPIYGGLAALSTGMLTFLAGQSFVTDFAHRKVDRWVLRLANVIAAVAGSWFLITHLPIVWFYVYALFFILASVLLFIPQLGQSDARAIQLVFLSVFPVLSTTGIQWGLGLTALAVVLYGAIQSKREGKTFLSIFKDKMSAPLVPLILTPFVVVLLATPAISALMG